MKLKDSVVLITDAANDFGRAIAARFVAEGARLVLNVPPDSPGEAPPLAGMGSTANTACKEEVDALIASVSDTYGRLDILVHTCNRVEPKRIEDCDDAAFERSLDLNVKSAFLFTQAAARVMMRAGGGNILYISSIHGEKPTGCDFAYGAAKGALLMLAREAALDLGPYGIRVNVLAAGALEGDDARFRSDRSPLYEHMVRRVPGRAAGSLEALAGAALFLVSGDGALFNGAELRADSGFLLNYGFRYTYGEYEALLEAAPEGGDAHES